MALHPKIAEVTARIEERSRETRAAYVARIDDARKEGPGRSHLSCGNLAHAFAASPLGDKLTRVSLHHTGWGDGGDGQLGDGGSTDRSSPVAVTAPAAGVTGASELPPAASNQANAKKDNGYEF